MMWQWIHKVGSPETSYRWAQRLQPWAAIACGLLLLYGVIAGLLLAPPDYQQGEVYRILYVHVPSAILSLSIYIVMALVAFIYLIWKIKLADIIAKVSAPIGASFTALTLLTGAIWGKPTWGTWWIWDARLTSELILLFIYIGIIALRAAISESRLAARATSMVIVLGGVNIPIVHYSVTWWNTLHQGASLHLFSQSSMVPSMLHPLLAMIAAFFCYYLWMLSLRVRAEWLQREQMTQWVKQLVVEKSCCK